MIPFDITKLSTVHVKLKSVTMALGGSMTIVDEDSTSANETYKRVVVPLAVARKFGKLYKVSQYLQPVLTAVTSYDNHVVAIERHPMGNLGEETSVGLFGSTKWKSDSEKNIEQDLARYVSDGDDWFIDGTLIYKVTGSDTESLTRDAKFASVPVIAIKMSDIITREVNTIDRTCLSFTTQQNETHMSPPIWKSLTNVGKRHLSKSNIDENSTEQDLQFDRIDEYLIVNLAFALKASKELSTVFGYSIIEPLTLDDLMIQLNTVNLPNVPKSTKNTFDTGMKFTHAMAWLIGLSSSVQTLDSYKVVRATMKFLTTKGVYHKTVLQDTAIYHDSFGADNIPMMTIQEAANAEMDGLNASVYEEKNTDVKLIGSLYGAE